MDIIYLKTDDCINVALIMTWFYYTAVDDLLLANTNIINDGNSSEKDKIKFLATN